MVEKFILVAYFVGSRLLVILASALCIGLLVIDPLAHLDLGTYIRNVNMDEIHHRKSHSYSSSLLGNNS